MGRLSAVLWASTTKCLGLHRNATSSVDCLTVGGGVGGGLPNYTEYKNRASGKPQWLAVPDQRGKSFKIVDTFKS
jgi:hypothetical protein